MVEAYTVYCIRRPSQEEEEELSVVKRQSIDIQLIDHPPPLDPGLPFPAKRGRFLTAGCSVGGLDLFQIAHRVWTRACWKGDGERRLLVVVECHWVVDGGGGGRGIIGRGLFASSFFFGGR